MGFELRQFAIVAMLTAPTPTLAIEIPADGGVREGKYWVWR